MRGLANGLEERCVQALRDYLAGQRENGLRAAHEVGRDALQHGLGVLDVSALLQRALDEVDLNGTAAHHREVRPFLLECYSPYDVAHRGTREANAALRQINEEREDEMRRLAHELHDQASDLLAEVHLGLDAVAADVAPEARERFERVRAGLRNVQTQLRRISHEMRPRMLDDLGLVPALQFLGDDVEKRGGLQIEVEGPSNGRLPPAIETVLYRAAQEALDNVVHHARASRVTLRVDRCDGLVELVVADDGVGFDPRVFVSGGRTGLGISGIRARVAPLGGTLEVTSAPARGTTLHIAIPILSLEAV